jgi:3-oxoacyl-[acyl-carrier protein] reductase
MSSARNSASQIARRSALKRMVDPDDVSREAWNSCWARAGRNITGTVLTVDAGNTA